mgnify:CR=1 FL=1
MVEAANRRQQGDACERTSASGTQGKNSTSSNETVIARASDSPQQQQQAQGVLQSAKQIALISSKTEPNEDEQRSRHQDRPRGSTTVSEFRSAEVERMDEGEQVKLEVEVESGGEEREEGEQGARGRLSRLKALLLLTAHLNPFHRHTHTHDHDHGANPNSSQPGGDFDEMWAGRESSTGAQRQQSPAKGAAQQQETKCRASGQLNQLMSFAQRYLMRRSSALRTDTNGTRSAPVTPVKWQPLDGDPRIKANGFGGAQLAANWARGGELEFEGQETQVGLCSAARHKQPSVRFVESLPVTGATKQRAFADCGVQTSGGSCAYESASVAPMGQVDVVSRLFKLPEVGESGAKLTLDAGESPMNSDKFRQYGYSLIDYISNYLDTIDKRRVTPLNIEPGYLKSLIQADPPERGESFANIMHDFENHIMCGITHWQHPHFHAYFPAGNAYPSILADMLSDALGCVGFSWAASPAYTELEIIMLDWMGKMIGLPDEFLCLSGARGGQESKGGGVIQGSASECVLVSLLAARHWAMEKLRKRYPTTADGILLSRLIGYCSKEAHSCVEKAAMIGFIRMRALETDERNSLRGDALASAISADLANGLEPFLVCATLGTTSCVSFDNLQELGSICKQHDLWLHVDAAYAGSALICPEFKYLIKGIELATSFNMNPNKWMLINFDCSLMWVKDRFKLTRAFVVDPLYLQHSFSDQAIDYRHWGIPLSRRFRALKLWFVIRNYGIEGLQAYIRNHVKLAKLFEQLIKEDPRFTITNEVVLGLVCFRLIGSNALNQRLLSMINASGQLHMVPASVNGRYVIRFCVCDQHAKEADIRFAYKCIADFASELFESIRAGRERIRAISQQNTIDVSSLSLHTQQSASADRLNNMAGAAETANESGAAKMGAGQQVSGTAPVSPREAARHYLLRRNSRHEASLTGGILSGEQPAAAGATLSPAPALATSPGGSVSRSLLTKQASVCGQAGELEEEDLEQEIVLDSLATDDELELLDDDLLGFEPAHSLEEGSLAASERVAGATPSEQGAGAAGAGTGEWRSPVARRWHSRAGRSSRTQTLAGSSGTARAEAEQAEAEDEVFTLAERRNRMSLRYKREFFVRVVSDPRVYRASISGDINAHASCCSLGAGGQPQAAATQTQTQAQKQTQTQSQSQTSEPSASQ